MTAPDRPGDRDRQQAEEIVHHWFPGHEPLTGDVAAALAAARADEKARHDKLVTDLRALLAEFEADRQSSARIPADRIRAVLDADRD